MRCPRCDWLLEDDQQEWCFNHGRRMRCFNCGWVAKEQMPRNWYARRVDHYADIRPRVIGR